MAGARPRTVPDVLMEHLDSSTTPEGITWASVRVTCGPVSTTFTAAVDNVAEETHRAVKKVVGEVARIFDLPNPLEDAPSAH